MPADPRLDDGYESAALRAPRLLAIAGAALALLFASIGSLALVFRAEAPGRSVPAPRLFPEPRLRVDETAQLRALEARQRERLSQYRWIDRQNGVIAIPIDRAMALIAQRGDAAYQPIPGAPTQPKATP
jgi:hypothetical protein